jgi:hypothetical protein
MATEVKRIDRTGPLALASMLEVNGFFILTKFWERASERIFVNATVDGQ